MYAEGSTGIRPSAAFELTAVTKTFSQRQRENAGGLLRGLLHPQRKTITALGDVSFSASAGEFIAYAGPNGAGKSTTMKLLCGLLVPEAGDVRVLGMTPRDDRVRLMRRVGVLFGNRSELWWDHPVAQSFEWKRVVWDVPRDVYRRQLAAVTDLLDIGGLLKTFARELSLGQRMRCDLALMLLHDPEVILLDEPTLGLDVVAKRRMIDFLKGINRERGTTIMVTSHDMDDLEEMAQRVLMIAGGRLVYDGRFDGLREMTGVLSEVRIQARTDAAYDVPGATLIAREGRQATWAVDLHAMPVRALMAALAAVPDIQNVEIGRPPIEKVVAQLYGRWREEVEG